MQYVKKVVPFFSDKRGTLSHLLEDDLKVVSALLITFKKGAIRANHYHKHDTHYCYMFKGEMEYIYQDMRKKNSRKKSVRVPAGYLVKTPPMVAHAMKFLTDGVFLTLSTEPRHRKDYEHDTKKVHLI